MTQTARKGKLYQLQFLLDLSCYYYITHPRVCWAVQFFSSTKLIYFAIICHKADDPVGTHRFARHRSPFGDCAAHREEGLGVRFLARNETLKTSHEALQEAV